MVDFPSNTSLPIGPVSAYVGNPTIQHISQHGDPDKFETGDLDAEFGQRLLAAEDIIQLFTDSHGYLITDTGTIRNRILFFQEYPTEGQIDKKADELVTAFLLNPTRDQREIVLDLWPTTTVNLISCIKNTTSPPPPIKPWPA